MIRKVLHAVVLFISMPAINEIYNEEPEDHVLEVEYVLVASHKCRGGAGE